MDYRELTLESLGNGVAMELFEELLKQVNENIADPNTNPKDVREITLTFKFKPNETRHDVSVSVHSKKKLAPFKPAEYIATLSNDGNQVRAYTTHIDQPEIFDEDERIRSINGGEA